MTLPGLDQQIQLLTIKATVLEAWKALSKNVPDKEEALALFEGVLTMSGMQFAWPLAKLWVTREISKQKEG